MKIEILGVGGGFSPELGNSSLLIWDDKGYSATLIDCGYSVFPRLKELERETDREIIRKIDTVFISHMHGDHVGSLSTLLQYRFFKLKLSTKLAGVDVSPLLSLTNIEDRARSVIGTDEKISLLPTQHIPGMPSFAGYIHGVLYSGDTSLSVLGSKEAEQAKLIIHEASLVPGNPSHIFIEDLAKSAGFHILSKTWLIHYNPGDYALLKEKAAFYRFAGVLTQEQVLVI